MPRLLINLAGQTFGRLVAKARAEQRSYEKHRGTKWLCTCSCTPGRVVRINSYDLRSGRTKSCGCLRAELSAARSIARGLKGKEYTNGNEA